MKDDGGSAFPLVHDMPPEEGFDRQISVEKGMSLRDYFAAAALRGVINRAWEEDGKLPDDILSKWAKVSYASAGAMIEERKKP